MLLTAAQDLKEEILAQLPSLRSHRGDDEGPLPPPMAIGVATTSRANQYRIAVRPQSEAALSEVVRGYLERASLGELDVRVTGPLTPASLPLTMGASTGHHSGCTGTIGFFARSADGRTGFVSNNHVIAAEDAGVDGDEILHPGLADGGTSPANAIGYLAGGYPRLQSPSPAADCAFARLADGVDFDAASLGRGETLKPTPIRATKRLRVRKIGRTTHRTLGRVTAFSLDDVVINYAFGETTFNGQIEVESINQKPFSRPGDSGSLIYDADGHPVGLLYAVSAAGGKTNSGLTYAHPIETVLQVLRVTLLT